MEDTRNTSNQSDINQDHFIACKSEGYTHYEEPESGRDKEKIPIHSNRSSKKETSIGNRAYKIYKPRIKNEQFNENSQCNNAKYHYKLNDGYVSRNKEQGGKSSTTVMENEPTTNIKRVSKKEGRLETTNVSERIFGRTNTKFNQNHNNKKIDKNIIKEDTAKKHEFHEEITENIYKENYIKPCEEVETYRFPINRDQAVSTNGKGDDHCGSNEMLCELRKKEEEYRQHDCSSNQEEKQTLLHTKFLKRQIQGGCRNWYGSRNNLDHRKISERKCDESENKTLNFHDNQNSSDCRSEKEIFEDCCVDQNSSRNERQFEENVTANWRLNQNNYNQVRKNDSCYKSQFCDNQINDGKNKKIFGEMLKNQSDHKCGNQNNRKYERKNEKQFVEEFKNSAAKYCGQLNQNNYGTNLRQSSERFGNQTNNWHNNRNYKKNDRDFGGLQNQIGTSNLYDNKKNGKHFHRTGFNNFKKGENNVQCSNEQRQKVNHYQSRKFNRPFTYRTNLDYNEEYRPNSVQSNYENKGKKYWFGSQDLERPTSSQSDYIVDHRNSHYLNRHCSKSTRNLSNVDNCTHQKIFSLDQGIVRNKSLEKGNSFGPRQSRGFYNHGQSRSKHITNNEKCLGYLHNSVSSSQSNSHLKTSITSGFSRNSKSPEDQCRSLGIEEFCNREKTEEDTKEDINSDSEKEINESNLETDQPFEVLSVDFKSEFPLSEAEALRMNIDLNEEVKDYLLFGKEDDVVVTEQPKTLRDIALFMQKYPNATAVIIKD